VPGAPAASVRKTRERAGLPAKRVMATTCVLSGVQTRSTSCPVSAADVLATGGSSKSLRGGGLLARVVSQTSAGRLAAPRTGALPLAGHRLAETPAEPWTR